MTWSEFFSSQLFGVIIGAIFTGGFTWFLDWLRSKRERKFRFQDKREETYVDIIKVFHTLLDNNWQIYEVEKRVAVMIDEIKAKAEMYASQEIKSLMPSFYDFFHKDEAVLSISHERNSKKELADIFNEILLQIMLEVTPSSKKIKKELGIKDV